MHWKTYFRICDEIDHLEYVSIVSMMQRYGVTLISLI